MKLLKHIIIGVVLASPVIATAQNSDGGEAPLSLNVYIPDNAGIPETAARNLEAKLSHAIAANGFGSQSFDNRFVIVPRAEVNSVTVTPTAPPKTVVDGTLYLYVGDGVTSTLFASEAFPVKGIGGNESQAFLSAFTKINPRDRRLQAMLETGRQRIKEYYEQQWPSMIKAAEAAYGEGNYENALSILYYRRHARVTTRLWIWRPDMPPVTATTQTRRFSPRQGRHGARLRTNRGRLRL